MATAAQITANSGPKTEAEKTAVAQNRTDGLCGRTLALLPNEDPAEFAQFLASLEEEHGPEPPTESFLVLELARAQWKIQRASAIEAELLAGEGLQTIWTEIAARFQSDASTEQALAKLNRYEQAARRAW